MPSMAERLYNVEIIVFKRNITPDNANEHGAEKQPDIDFSNAILANNASALAKKGLKKLSLHQLTLTNEYNRLKNHAGYTPLLHLGWRQDDRSRAQLPKLIFQAGENFNQEFDSDGNQLAENELTQEAILFELDGYIRLYVQHYLFIETDLVLRVPSERKILAAVEEMPFELNHSAFESVEVNGDNGAPDENADLYNTGATSLEPRYQVEKYLLPYSFKHKRRIRSGEIHYLDHPLMGLIIKVTKA